jgi:phage gpG-like protein
MSATVTAKVVGADAVERRLLGMSAKIHQRIVRAVTRLGIELQRDVKTLLSGPALSVRTGRLRRGVNQRTDDDGATVRSRTGENVEYAAFHELGYHGSQTVKAHQRTSAFGRETKPFTVPQHSRRVDYAGRPFLRPALDAKRADIKARIERAVKGGDNGR